MIEQLVQPSPTSPQLRDIAAVTGTPGEGADWKPAADWTARWLTTFDTRPPSTTVQARYVSEGRKHAPESIDDNRVPRHILWGVSGAWAFDVDVRDTRVKQNLLDEDPPLTGSGVGGTHPVFVDTVGRRYRVGLRASF